MAFDAFLQIAGIPGESTDTKYTNWIEVKAFSHQIDQPVTDSVSSGGGRTGQRTNHGAFVIVKELDAASAKLEVYCCNGTHIPNIQLSLARASGDKTEYMTYVLTDSIVQKVAVTGVPDGDGKLPREEVWFAYGSITWTYTQTDHKTGKAKGNITGTWSTETNTGG